MHGEARRDQQRRLRVEEQRKGERGAQVDVVDAQFVVAVSGKPIVVQVDVLHELLHRGHADAAGPATEGRGLAARAGRRAAGRGVGVPIGRRLGRRPGSGDRRGSHARRRGIDRRRAAWRRRTGHRPRVRNQRRSLASCPAADLSASGTATKQATTARNWAEALPAERKAIGWRRTLCAGDAARGRGCLQIDRRGKLHSLC